MHLTSKVVTSLINEHKLNPKLSYQYKKNICMLTLYEDSKSWSTLNINPNLKCISLERIKPGSRYSMWRKVLIALKTKQHTCVKSNNLERKKYTWFSSFFKILIIYVHYYSVILSEKQGTLMTDVWCNFLHRLAS